jgi:quercetin dioxygenase-like cupin family protein
MKVEKPWGHEIRWAINSKYLGKILHINAGNRLSLQYHEEKDETIYVMKGTAIVLLDGNTHILSEGESLRILPKQVHRYAASPDGDVKLIEVSTPEIDDVVRLQDDYGRENDE